MDRPDMTKPFLEDGGGERLVARTQSIEEANRIAQQYEMQGFKTRIVKISQGTIALFEVWIKKEFQRM